MVLQTIEKQALETVDQQEWLDQISEPVQQGTNRVLASRSGPMTAIANFLHGTWLGHPLHPVLTDFTIGSFTAAVSLDLLEMSTGENAYGKSADAALGIGLGSAAATILAGLADWNYTDGEARRTGSLHAIFNLTSTVFYVASLVLRRGKKRSAGRALSFTGYLFSFLAAYLGGDLVYRQKIGVNHSQTEPLTREWKQIMPLADLREGEMRRVDVDGIQVLLARRGDRVFAINEICAHMGGPLSEGQLMEDFSVVCPWHGSQYDLETGKVLRGPSAYAQPCYEIRFVGENIQIRQREAVNQS